MSIAYQRSVSPIDMQDGRRRAWAVPGKPGHFEVISRDSGQRYHVEVVGGMPLCDCTAAQYGRPCWHASLVLARIEREGADASDDPSDQLVDWVAARVAELTAKKRLTEGEREELAILTYAGPTPRRVPFSDEVPF